MIRQKQQERKLRAQESREQLFIVVLLSNLKRMGEGALRWSFFTLNVFILTLYICSTSISPEITTTTTMVATNSGIPTQTCPPGSACMDLGFIPI